MKKLTILVISTAFIFSINAAHAKNSASTSELSSSTNKLFLLKGKAPTGSKIPSIEATSTVPFHKTFGALTAEQQNLVRAKFDSLRSNDTPPFPRSGLRAVYKPLVKANKEFGDDSDINVTAKINSAGFVNGVTVHNSNNAQLVSYIQRHLQNTRFEPAKCDGIACDMDFPIDISFN
ncbi:MAG: hypothetical protein ACI854_000373 [Arenicella sp.]|jgi:hypothetical protein